MAHEASTSDVKPATGLNLFITSLFVLAMALIMAVMIGMLMAILVWRIVVLWVLILLSPLAFFAKGIGHLLDHAPHWYSKWWDQLVSAILVGPFLTFFIWLAMTTVASEGQEGLLKGFDVPAGGLGPDLPVLSTLFQGPQLMSFVVAIALLFIGIEVATETASAMGGVAGQIMHGGEKYAKMAGKAPFKGAAWVGKKTVAEPVRDQWRGRTMELRQDVQNRVAQGKARANAASGPLGVAQRRMWDVVGGASGLVFSSKKDEKKHQEELAKKVEEKGLDALSMEEKLAFINKNTNTLSEEKQAKVNAVRAGIVGNEEEFANYMRTNPAEAMKMLAAAQKYNKNTGNKEANEKIDTMLKKNMAWKQVDAGGVTAALADMTAQDKQGLHVRNWESAAFREGWRKTDLYKKMAGLYDGYDARAGKLTVTADKDKKKDAERARSGYTDAQLKKFDEMIKMDYTDPGHDEREVARAQREMDAMRGLDMAAANNKARAQSNATYSRLESAVTNGSVGALLGAGVDLSEVNTAQVRDSYVNAGGNVGDANRRITDVFTAVAGDKNAANALYQLRTSASGSAGNMRRFMDITGVKTALATKASSSTTPADKRPAYQMNHAVYTGEVDAYGYDTATGEWTGADDTEKNANARAFQVAVAKQGLLTLAVKDKMLAVDRDGKMTIAKGGAGLVKEVAEGQDRKSLQGLVTSYEESIGGEGEEQQRQIVETVGQVIRAHWDNIKNDSTVPKATKDAVQANMDFYNRRVARQVEGKWVRGSLPTRGGSTEGPLNNWTNLQS
jgi:hypothetical protein